jgi:hypothetical protein
VAHFGPQVDTGLFQPLQRQGVDLLRKRAARGGFLRGGMPSLPEVLSMSKRVPTTRVSFHREKVPASRGSMGRAEAGAARCSAGTARSSVHEGGGLAAGVLGDKRSVNER